MKLLLDTHVLLWAATIPDELGSEAREMIEDGTQDVLVSVVSAWEIAIKQSLGKLELPTAPEQWLPVVLRRSGRASPQGVRTPPDHVDHRLALPQMTKASTVADIVFGA